MQDKLGGRKATNKNSPITFRLKGRDSYIAKNLAKITMVKTLKPTNAHVRFSRFSCAMWGNINSIYTNIAKQ